MRKINSYGRKGVKIGTISLILVIASIAMLFAFLFFYCIFSYSNFDIEYSDLIYGELTFDRYEKLYRYKGGDQYEIYFEEFEEPFDISPVLNKKIDKKKLELLTAGEEISLFYRESSSKNYKYEICEISHNSTAILSLSDYVKVNKNNQILGMIFCPIMVIMALFMVWLLVALDMYPKRPEKKPGRVMLEYSVGENVIRVCKSLDLWILDVNKMWYLEINGKMVDRRLGMLACNFLLQGKVKIEEKKIPVKAKIGQFNIQLYCDGDLVATKRKWIG